MKNNTAGSEQTLKAEVVNCPCVMVETGNLTGDARQRRVHTSSSASVCRLKGETFQTLPDKNEAANPPA